MVQKYFEIIAGLILFIHVVSLQMDLFYFILLVNYVF